MSNKIYPSWRYHKTELAKIVHSAEEDNSLGKGWADSPAEFDSELNAKPEKQKIEDSVVEEKEGQEAPVKAETKKKGK